MPLDDPLGSLPGTPLAPEPPPLGPGGPGRRPPAPSTGGGRRFDPQLLAPLAILAAAIASRGNPNVLGFAGGFGQAGLRQQELQRRLGQDQAQFDAAHGQQQTQFDAQLAQRKAELEEARTSRAARERQTAMAPLIREFGELAPTLTSKRDYEAAIARYEAMAAGLGGRPNLLRTLFPYRAPHADRRAAEYVRAFVANRQNAAALQHPQFRDLPVELDLNDDGTDELHTMGELIKLAGPINGMALDQAGRPFIAPKDTNPSEFERALAIATQEFTADNGRPPRGDDPKEARLIYEKAQELAQKPSTRDPQLDDLNRQLAQLRVDRERGAQPAPELPEGYQVAVRRITMMLPAARRTEVSRLVNDLWREGDEAQVKEVIRQAAIEGENIDTQRQVEGRRVAIRALGDIRQMLQELKAEGVDTNLLRGSAEDVARKLGTSTNPKLATLGTRVMETLFEYRRALTGVQFSFREQQQYQGMFPNYKNTFPLNEAILDGLLRGMQLRDQAFWTQKLGRSGATLVGALGDPQEDSTPGDERTGSPLDRLRQQQPGR